MCTSETWTPIILTTSSAFCHPLALYRLEGNGSALHPELTAECRESDRTSRPLSQLSAGKAVSSCL